MALLTQDGKYIKINDCGDYEIYLTQGDRDITKYSTQYSVIREAYLNKINELLADEERQYYDYEEWGKEYSEWTNEFSKYSYDYVQKKGGGEYPLMEEIYSDVSNSIPIISQCGGLCIGKRSSVREAYEVVKDRKNFGITEDC